MLPRRTSTKARRKNPSEGPRGHCHCSHLCTRAALLAFDPVTQIQLCSALLALRQDAPASSFCIGQYVHQIGSSWLSHQMAQKEGLLPLSLRDSRLRFHSHGAFPDWQWWIIQWGEKSSYKVTWNLQRKQTDWENFYKKNKNNPKSPVHIYQRVPLTFSYSYWRLLILSGPHSRRQKRSQAVGRPRAC